MANTMKRHGFLPSSPRFFTRSGQDAADLFHFRATDLSVGDACVTIDCPDHWSETAAELFITETASSLKPVNLRTIEENTVPSWLWKHSATGKGTETESRVQNIIDRVVGAATYNGWKSSLCK